MPAYVVSYDLNKQGQDYSALYAELKESPNWWHFLDSTWLIITGESVHELAERLRARIDRNDWLLVMPVRRPADGWLKQEAWDWIEQNVPL